ncbi:hypothetical protein [Qipengyuania flava]|uniref:hypothetical protein n=1 Tax=Qipengyuania flava TaxID=192812 RepID=UPI00321C25A5
MTDLTQFSINGVTPFYSPGDTGDSCLAEAYALLQLLAGAHQTCEEAGADAADSFNNIRHEITGRALDGIGTLIALGLSQYDAHRRGTKGNSDPARWVALSDAFASAHAAMLAHEALPDNSKCGSPDNLAHEDKTERLATAQAEAFDAMMLEPAPNRAALAIKMRAYHDISAADGWDNGGKIAAMLASDATRLL